MALKSTERFFLTLAASTLAIYGCGEPTTFPPMPPQTVSLKYGNPDSDKTRCSCASSRPAFLRNSGASAKRVQWQVSRRDRISGQLYAPQLGDSLLPPTGGGEGQFVGCSIDDPATSCRFDASYTINSVSAMMSVSSALVSTLGTRVAASAASCQAICSAPNSGSDGSCLTLGVRYSEAVAPVRVMLEGAVASGTEVKKTDILLRLGLKPGDDRCERSDVTNDNGLLSNSGPSSCQFRSRDLPKSALIAAGVAVINGKQSGMSLILPELAAYRAIGAATSVGLVGEQQGDKTSPLVQFDGAGADKLNARYGGPLQSLSRIALAGRPPQTVMQTANGCIAVDEAVQ